MVIRMSVASFALAAGLVSGAWAADPVSRAVEVSVPEEPIGAISGAPVKFRFPLSKFVAQAGPLKLRDASTEAKIALPLSSRLKPTSMQVTLVLTNSIALLAAKSAVTVRINDATLAQIRLDPNSPNAAVKVNIPVDLLRPGFNTMALSVAQHTGDDCEDPEAPELWTEINTAESSVDLTADYRNGPFRLADFDEFFSPGIGGARHLNIVTAGAGADPQILSAGSLVTQAVALRAQYEPVKVRKADLAGEAWSLDDHVLIGTRDELAVVLGAEEAAKIDGPYLALSALDKRQMRIVVSGKTVQDVATAAKTLAYMDVPLIDSASSLIREVKDTGLSPRRVGTLEADRIYSFDELGLPTTTARGAGVSELSVELPMAPDFYAPEQAKVDLSLDFNYGAGFGSGSVLNVEINGKFLHGIGLMNENGGAFRDYRIAIPLRDFIGGSNRISFSVHMRAERKGKCSGTSGRYLATTVFGTSSVRLPPAGHLTVQPDLDLFGRTGFPYVGLPKGGEVWVSNPDLISAAWTVTGRIAQAAGRSLPDMTFRVGGEAPKGASLQIAEVKALSPKLFAATMNEVADQRKRVPYGAFGTATGRAAPGLIDTVLGTSKTDPEIGVSPVKGYVAQTGTLGRNAVMTALRSESGEAATTTIITADTTADLNTAIDRLVQPQYWGRAKGDFMMWRDTPESVTTFRFSPRFQVGESQNATLSLRLAVSQNPWWWLGGTAGLLVILSGLTVWILARRRKF